MITKYVLTGLLIVIAWLVFSRFQRGRTNSRPRPPIVAQETVRCPDCGIYLPTGHTCGCADRA